MKKNIILGIAILVSIFAFGLNVKAECHYGIPSPEIYTNGTWRKDTMRKTLTTADSCYGTNSSVYFSDGSVLPMGRFNVHAELWEEDPAGNDDEKVKTYKGYNSGYTLMTWTYLGITTSGLIDGSGDQTCELYMRFKIELIDASPYTIMDSDLFKYTMCMS